VLPKSETRRVHNAVLKRYWYHAWWFYAHSIVRDRGNRQLHGEPIDFGRAVRETD